MKPFPWNHEYGIKMRLKLTYSKVESQKFSGGYTAGTLASAFMGRGIAPHVQIPGSATDLLSLLSSSVAQKCADVSAGIDVLQIRNNNSDWICTRQHVPIR